MKNKCFKEAKSGNRLIKKLNVLHPYQNCSSEKIKQGFIADFFIAVASLQILSSDKSSVFLKNV